MLRMLLQFRNYTKAVKAKTKHVLPISEVKKSSIFDLNIQQVCKLLKPVEVKKQRQIQKSQNNTLPVISCKRPKFNLYNHNVVEINAKYKSIPLATDGWQHHKSKNDFFIVNPSINEKFNTVDLEAEHVMPFDTLDLDEILVDNLQSQFEVTKTTFIQYAAIPVIASGVNTVMAAETGCGKTIAYLLPIIMSILKQKKMDNEIYHKKLNTPRALILAPSQELAFQIGEVAKKLTRHLFIDIKVMTGGFTKTKLMNPIFEPVDILISSVGILNKMITKKIYRMEDMQYFVLDEADTLFDSSFRGPLEYMLRNFGYSKQAKARVTAQLIMVFASMPGNTRELVSQIVDPTSITEVVSPNLHKLLPQIQQKFIRLRKAQRPLELLSFVKPEIEKGRPIIVFGNKAATTDYISMFLNDNGVKAVSLNGSMSHKIRVNQLFKFQSGDANVIATTDVSSRGLDTTRACHVINYDFPYSFTDYLHRIGRIGRMGSAGKGSVMNFVSSMNELELVKKIEHAIRTQGTIADVNNNFTRNLQKEEREKVQKSVEKETPFPADEFDKTF